MADGGRVADVRIMGVVNVTPDSFSDGGLFLEPERAIAHGRRLLAEGADILDIGGESTRPGAPAVGVQEELARVEPVVAGLRDEGAPISIDTSKVPVAAAAVEAGAAIVNDITAFRADEEMADFCAERGVEVVLMHMLGDPRTMQDDPRYDDVVDDVRAFLEQRAEFAVREGVREERITVDPGIGFGKTLDHNLELLARLDELLDLGRPVVIGTSRKSFIGKIDGSPVDERQGGTIASSAIAAANGASVIRVHEVAMTVEVLRVVAAVLGPGDWHAQPAPG
jgi:dihydropteroate synthase